MKKNRLRQALISSIMSLTLCCLMLMGTTYAWLTDSVTSGTNRIVAGTLDVDLLTYKETSEGRTYTSIAGKSGDLFAVNASEDVQWEPATSDSVKLAVKNNGNLNLKYQINLIVKDAGLAEWMDYAILFENEEAETSGNDTVKKNEPSDDDWQPLSAGTAASENGTVFYITIPEERLLGTLADSETSDNLNWGEHLDHFELYVRMRPNGKVSNTGTYLASDTPPENAQCEIDMSIIATQNFGETNETSDDHQEENRIVIPKPVIDDYIYHFATVEIKKNDDTYVTAEPIAASSSNAIIQIELPEHIQVDLECEPDEDEECDKVLILAVTPKTIPEDIQLEGNQEVRTLHVQVYGVSEDNQTPFILTQNIGPGNKIVQILYSNVLDEDDSDTDEIYEFVYDSETGDVTMETTQQGMFTIIWESGTDTDN